jgi:CRISPR-associated protein Csm4
MNMTVYRLILQPLTAFGTRPLGDTLFGQLCWALRHRHGENRLNQLLDGYTEGKPFAVLSDALPDGYLPRPTLPGLWFDAVTDETGKPLDRKLVKKRAWLPWAAFDTPVAHWLNHCRPASAIAGAAPEAHPQPHNSLHRITGTTGGEGFAPYSMTQYWYGGTSGEQTRLAIHAVIDETRIDAGELKEALEDMGRFGFGRDASIGLGKFDLLEMAPAQLPVQAHADAWLTLAPCAPQGLGLDPKRSYYQTFTRFGRHGDIGVHLGSPFKTPVLLAQTGAVFAAGPTMSPPTPERPWLGQGLGGAGRMTRNPALAGTVQQAYAPVLGLRLPQRTSP